LFIFKSVSGLTTRLEQHVLDTMPMITDVRYDQFNCVIIFLDSLHIFINCFFIEYINRYGLSNCTWH
ncbi:hypothetical protein ACJX0J_025262, partial [Zea mays]